MSLNEFSEFVCVLLLLLFAVNTDSQRIRFVEDNDYRPRTQTRQESPNCNCIPIRRCYILRNRRDWRRAGETCEFGYGEYRRVCCPRRMGQSPPITVAPPTIINVRPSPRIGAPPTIIYVRPSPRIATPTPRTEGCGQSAYVNIVNPLIMGGENATEGSWPWMVAVRMRETSGIYAAWCSGFLIDRRHVLSAAHCYDTRNPDRYRARIGSINQDTADEYQITRIEVPAGYTAGMFYDDIAVLTLDREVNFPNFNPICLPDEEVSSMNLRGRGTTVAGWGADRPRGELKTYLQQLSRVPVVSNQRCQRVLRENLRNVFQRQFPRGIVRDIICAGFTEGGKDACGGDSGGPLMIQNRNRWYAIGIVSFGYSCGRPGIPGGYTKVANYLDWINQNIRD